jgi:TRAP transporter TAXI family solute receptor
MGKKFFFITVVLAALAASTVGAQTIGIGTSNPGSATHSIGSAIAKLITEQLGTPTRVQPHSGNSAFIPAINAGEVDFGPANVLEMRYALTGTGIYRGQVLKDLRVVTVLMPNKVGIWVQKDSYIKSIKDLKGKRVPGLWTSQKVIQFITKGLLANGGLTYDDVDMVPVSNVNGAADDFIRGKADTFFFAVGAGKVREAGAKVGGLRCLSIDPSPEAVARLQEHMPVMYPLFLEPSKSNYGITEPTYVGAFDFLFLTNSRMPDDVIYKVTKALYGGQKSLFASYKPLGANFSPDKMAKILPAGEYHSGAIKFYTEVGLWPPKEGVVAK